MLLNANGVALKLGTTGTQPLHTELGIAMSV
jgi:hypothetical protein